MTDKLVTHEDLPRLQEIRATLADFGYGPDNLVVKLADRLIAAAEADQPPLPEGWVVMNAGMDGHVSQGVFWHRGGLLYQWSDDETAWGGVDANKDRLTPLRPTVTEADVEKAVDAAWNGGEVSDEQAHKLVRAALKAAGIEVRDV